MLEEKKGIAQEKEKEMKKDKDYCIETEPPHPDTCILRQFQRVNYFPRQLLGVSEFRDEHNYLNDKRHLINKLVHGQGIICGLEVCGIRPRSEKCYQGPDGEIRMVSEGWEVCLSVGTALDCLGQEIVVSKKDEWWPVVGTKGPEHLDNKLGLYIRRKDVGKKPVPSPKVACSCEEVCCYSRTEENFEILFDSLPDITQLTFDASTYSECDSATIILVKSKEDSLKKSEPDIPNITLEYTDKESGDSKQLTVEVTHIVNLNVADAFSGSVDLQTDIQVKPDSVLTCRYKLDERTLQAVARVRTFTREELHNQTRSQQSEPYHQRELYPKLKRRIAEDYYKLWLSECICCADPQDPKVLLAVLGKKDKNELGIDDDLGTWFRDIVHNNKMLYDLISIHSLDTKNPHEVTAYQTGALKRINGLGNQDNQCGYIPEITLQEGTNIQISTVNDRTIRISTKLMAGTGLLTFSLGGHELRLEGPFSHDAIGDNITPPAISLGEEALDYLFEWVSEVFSEDDIKNIIQFLNSRIYTKIPVKRKGLKVKKDQGSEQNSIIFTVTLQNGDEKTLHILRLDRDTTRATALVKDAEGKDEISIPLIVCGHASDAEGHSKPIVYAQKQPQTIRYMEDLWLFFLLDKYTTRPQDKEHSYIEKQCSEKSDLLRNYLRINSDGNKITEDDDDPFPFVFFKAVNITPTDFCVLLVNYSNNHKCITLRWNSNPASKKEWVGAGTGRTSTIQY